VIALKPSAEQQETFAYKTKVAGYLEARITPHDAFPQDDRALIELPAQQSLHVVVYSAEPQMLRALIASNPQVEAVFEAPAKYDANVKADIVVLDRFAPPARPHADSIWIEPPASGSPIPVRQTKAGVKLEHWRPETALGAGLHTKNAQLESGEILDASRGDIVVADAAEGPLVVARPGSPKLVVIGFEPMRSSMKYELATPLLIANLMRWMAPETFRRWDVQAGTVGTVSVDLDKGVIKAWIRRASA
jgi:hypothetical protein